jgi:hypothetical protein
MDFLFPIKVMLRKKVKRYKVLLSELKKELDDISDTKFRRQGYASSLYISVISKIFLYNKYLKFINKWDLKK